MNDIALFLWLFLCLHQTIWFLCFVINSCPNVVKIDEYRSYPVSVPSQPNQPSQPMHLRSSISSVYSWILRWRCIVACIGSFCMGHLNDEDDRPAQRLHTLLWNIVMELGATILYCVESLARSIIVIYSTFIHRLRISHWMQWMACIADRLFYVRDPAPDMWCDDRMPLLAPPNQINYISILMFC